MIQGSLGLTDAEMKNFVRVPSVGVPFRRVKAITGNSTGRSEEFQATRHSVRTHLVENCITGSGTQLEHLPVKNCFS
jgi:hypothetical protein